jgi:hypothetical protein
MRVCTPLVDAKSRERTGNGLVNMDLPLLYRYAWPFGDTLTRPFRTVLTNAYAVILFIWTIRVLESSSFNGSD